MSDFVMNLAVVLLTPWVGFCSKCALRYCKFSLKPTMLPPLVLGSAQFASFPGKRECFNPQRELFVCLFPC